MYSSMKILSISLFLIGSVQAASISAISIENTNGNSAAAFSNYWTPERMKAAKPLNLPQASGIQQTYVPFEVSTSPKIGMQGMPPQNKARIAPKYLFTPEPAATNSIQAVPLASGSFGASYTSTRVFPLYTGASASLSADQTYPYSAVGKLFFSINGQDFVCSGSVIAKRVVVTAGHCVHSGTVSGNNNGYYSNWMFVPAYRDGVAPFGTWRWGSVTTTNTWAFGGGGVPNAADYAMISFQDQPDNLGRINSLGNVTGWLGWQTLSLAANHTSKLGYPLNLDGGGKMQNVTSGAFRQTSSNTVEYGSDATGGSSGGPWVQNFQLLQTGGGTGLNAASNRVVGVSSYGYISPDPKVAGASIFDSRFVEIYNLICAAQAGNCTP